MPTTALLVGRFQPFHKGHLKFVEWATDRCDKIIIGIGSSQENNTRKNPFSFEERKQMIESSLTFQKDRLKIIALPDINDPPNWVKHVKSIAPGYNIIYTNSDLEKELFKKAGDVVVSPPFFARKKFKAMDIREHIASGESWRNLVPEGTLRVIQEVNGVERIRNLKQP
ncbi:nicotinamide-nucleotide adenylyltransferase [Candidatus Altiarchaeota archaeon]